MNKKQREKQRRNRNNSCAPKVSISVEEYSRLVYESARNDIVRHLLMAEYSAYADTNALRIVMGLRQVTTHPCAVRTAVGFREAASDE